MAWAPSTEIRTHVCNVVAASFEPITREVQAAYIQSLMAHLRFNGFRLPDNAFDIIQGHGEAAACLTMATWDGVDYDWERGVNSLLRQLESRFTRWIPAAS